MKNSNLTKCLQCEGTGAYNPTCWLCEGELYVSVTHAKDAGYTLDISDNGKDCRCPADGCYGDCCEVCEGTGMVEQRVLDDEVTRVLMYGLSQKIPPRLYRFNHRTLVEYGELLSDFAGAICRENKWINHHRSIFGDNVHLTDAGEIEAKNRVHGWHKSMDADTSKIDTFGCWADDGGLQS